MELLVWILVGAMLFFSVLYFIVSAAVEEGTLKALLRYEGLKNRQGNSESAGT